MLQGRMGEARQLAMEIIVNAAHALDADRLIEVVSVQAMAHFGSLHEAGRDWLEKLAALGGRCCVFTTQDPASIPFEKWEAMGYGKEYAGNQIRLRDAILKLGQVPAWSCTPYNQGSLPRFGQNVAWAESSAVSYANSVLGARTNRTPAGFAICAALTGRAPYYGLYLPQNRKAQLKVYVDAGQLNDLDYNTLGVALGKLAGNKIPALYGIPANATNDNLKYLGASAAASGSVALYHAAGVTPEALERDPFDRSKPEQEIVITRAHLEETAHALSTPEAKEPELVVTGCPHSSAAEIMEIGRLMEGRRVKEAKAFWIFTTAEAEALMRRSGVVPALERAGVTMMPQTCLVISPLVGGYKTLMTDSGKFACYLPSEHNVELVYGSIADCVLAVTETETAKI